MSRQIIHIAAVLSALYQSILAVGLNTKLHTIDGEMDVGLLEAEQKRMDAIAGLEAAELKLGGSGADQDVAPVEHKHRHSKRGHEEEAPARRHHRKKPRPGHKSGSNLVHKFDDAHSVDEEAVDQSDGAVQRAIIEDAQKQNSDSTTDSDIAGQMELEFMAAYAKDHPIKASMISALIIFMLVFGCCGPEHKLSAEKERRLELHT